MSKNVTVMNFTKEYASQEMDRIPAGYINKKVCGCGLTTVALENDRNTIIFMPSVALVDNKAKQYPNERFSGSVLPVYGKTTAKEIEDYQCDSAVLKIACTYDSIDKVCHLLDNCDFIIDESDRLLGSIELKTSGKKDSEDGDAITNIMSYARIYSDTVSFISATPTPLEYMPTWVSNISQIEMNWANTINVTPIIMERNHPYRALRDEIISPLKDGSITLSDKIFSKALIFVNSIDTIVDIVKQVKLNKKDVAVICGDSTKNDKKIKGLNRLTKCNQLPKYTFSTSTGFQGLDIYDKEVMSIVVSNTAKKWQMVDIATDLKQATSRQRDKSNPNYDSYVYIYNQSVFTMEKDDLKRELDEKHTAIKENINLWEIAKKKHLIKGFAELPDTKIYTNKIDDEYEINEMRFQADAYYILETLDQYRKGFCIQSNLGTSSTPRIVQFIGQRSVTYSDTARFFKENNISGIVEWPEKFKNSTHIVTVEKCYKDLGKVWINQSQALKMLEGKSSSKLLKTEIKGLFKQGHSYSRKEVKCALNKVYEANGISKKAKHGDVKEYYTQIRFKKIRGENMVEIIKR